MSSFQRLCSLLFLFLCVLVCSSGIRVQAEQRPNILILLGDDIDRDSLGPWGGQVHTPNLDQLASEGMRFDGVYCNVAMCAPFRQELYSGRSAWRTRAMPNHSRSVKGTRSLPHYLRPLGYRVALLGKGHIGPYESYPFDKLGDLPKNKDANPLAIQRATEYMTKARDAGKPFCLVVASHDGHGPYTHGNVRQYDKDKLELAKGTVDTSVYRGNLVKHFAEVTNLDSLLGQLRSVLAKEQLADNTLVLFCSEQGNAFPFAKWTCFDDGLASGVVAALPGVIPAGKTCDQIMWLSDIAPTLITAAGGDFNERDFDGRSQWRNFTGGNQAIHEYAYGAFLNCNILDNKDRVFPIRSIRDQRYSLIWSPLHDQGITSNTTLTQALEIVESKETPGNVNVAASWVVKAQQTKSKQDDTIIERFHQRPEWALYDRSSDSEELVNLIDDPKTAKVAERLQKALKAWLEKWGDSDPVATERSFIRG